MFYENNKPFPLKTTFEKRDLTSVSTIKTLYRRRDPLFCIYLSKTWSSLDDTDFVILKTYQKIFMKVPHTIVARFIRQRIKTKPRWAYYWLTWQNSRKGLMSFDLVELETFKSNRYPPPVCKNQFAEASVNSLRDSTKGIIKSNPFFPTLNQSHLIISKTVFGVASNSDTKEGMRRNTCDRESLWVINHDLAKSRCSLTIRRVVTTSEVNNLTANP